MNDTVNAEILKIVFHLHAKFACNNLRIIHNKEAKTSLVVVNKSAFR